MAGHMTRERLFVLAGDRGPSCWALAWPPHLHTDTHNTHNTHNTLTHQGAGAGGGGGGGGWGWGGEAAIMVPQTDPSPFL